MSAANANTAERPLGDSENRGDSDTLLRCEQLTKTYRGTTAPAVESLDLDVRRGEFVTLLGSSGSGKSTTLMMVAGFESPNRGTVTLAGRDVTALPAHQRNIGVVFQNYLLFPNMTVAQNIAFPLKMRKTPKSEIARRVADVLELVDLGDFGHRRPSQLSGGQQQRVAVARAIVSNPQLLLMDEPLGALDERLRKDLQQELRHIHRELGATVLYVTHDQQEAMSLSDRIVLMRQGVVEQESTPAELYERPATPYAARFMGVATFLRGTVESGGAEGRRPVRLEATGQVLEVPGVDGLGAGDRVDVMLRDSAVRLTEPGERPVPGSGITDLPVDFSDATYVGDAVRLNGRLPSGEDVNVLCATADVPEAGTKSSVSVVLERAWCVRAATEDTATEQGLGQM